MMIFICGMFKRILTTFAKFELLILDDLFALS